MTAHVEQFASLTDARISSRLGEVKRRVMALGEELEGSVHGRVGGFVSGLLGELEAHSCRIVVIGQIKAGKSTLINALIRRPDLLPTDINPSTAVITKLYFGAPAEQTNTALFQFFSDDEWERIMSGGRAGALTMQRSETLRPEHLEGPLEELRQRAEQRLGPQYPQMLGKHHLFSSVTSELLERYVSAGDYSGAPDNEGGRHFSDITKTAEIYLDGQPLGYPSVIIDTPGVNDPFMVRDEITHGNLGEADIYLVVLTAQQPLSSSDLALLRMLKGLQKDRIIAVVNRIDIVNIAGGEAERLAAHVRASLRREFPHAEIPVILASAHWGNNALSGDDEELALALTASPFADYAAEMAHRGERGFERPKADWPRERVAQMLYRASGIPAIVSAISRLIGHSVTSERLLPAASSLGAVAENTAISMRHGLKTLSNSRGRGEDWLKGGALRQLLQLEHLLAQLEGALTSCEHEFAVLTGEEIDRLRKFMNYTVDNFAERQRERLLQLGAYGPLRPEFQEQTFQLRSQLAEDFYKYITEISKQFLAKQQEAEAALRQTVKAALPDLDDVLHFGIQAGSLPPPSIMPLSKMTALDADSYWQARAHASRVNTAEADKFRQTVTVAFLELIDELFEHADATRQDHIGEALRRLRFLSYSAVYPIAQQLQQLVMAQQAVAGDLDHAAPFMWEQFLADCRAQLQHCEKLGAESAEIRRQCIQLMSN